MEHEPCDRYVYFDGEFGWRLDQRGVDYLIERIREELSPERAKQTLDTMEIRDHYHKEDTFPIGADARWLRQQVFSYGGLFNVND